MAAQVQEGFLRTRFRQLPSERTVKSVVANLLIRNLTDSAPEAIIQEITERYGGKKRYFKDQLNRPNDKKLYFSN